MMLYRSIIKVGKILSCDEQAIEERRHLITVVDRLGPVLITVSEGRKATAIEAVARWSPYIRYTMTSGA